MQGWETVMDTALAENLETVTLSARASKVGSAVGGWVARYGSHSKTVNPRDLSLE